MRAVVQRVRSASVTVGAECVGRISAGLCVLVGAARGDTEADAKLLADKVVGLRVFEDDQGKMNLSLGQTAGQLLAVSQFTLLGDVRRGRRPSFSEAMEPERAADIFRVFCENVARQGIPVETGRFRASMLVELSNDGPVTLLIDTARVF